MAGGLKWLACAAVGAALLCAQATAQTVRRDGGDGADLMARPYGANPGDENRPAGSGMRDANGNLIMVNGKTAASPFYSASPDALTFGVMRGTTGASTNATAVGNLLTVNVTGNYNTVIVNSNQTNNGTQSVILNGGVKLD